MRASLECFRELVRDDAAAQPPDEAEAMPLMHQPILAAREFILALLLGAAASCLALVAGMFLGFGETGLGICFATLTILIVLYVAAAPAPIAMASLRRLRRDSVSPSISGTSAG